MDEEVTGTPIRDPVRPSSCSRASKRRSLRRVSSCSQMRTIFQPSARSSRFTRRSRALLPASFAAQKAALVLG